jgi:hypothetical protein
MTNPDNDMPAPVDAAAQERWKARIKKLLQKAEHTDSQAERDECNSRAFALASKFRIDLAKLQAEGENVTERIVVVMIEIRKPFIQRMSLLMSFARVNGCAGVRMGKKSSSIELVELSGYESDVDLTRMLFASVATQAERGFAAATVPASTNARAFKRRYWEMFTAAVYTRLKKAREAQTVRHGTAGTAIALRDKDALVQEDVAFRHPHLGKARKSRTRYGPGHHEGYRDGMRADLGTTAKVDHFHQAELEG